MAETFYPFVENPGTQTLPTTTTPAKKQEGPIQVSYAARIAIYDDLAAAPRVVVIQPGPIHDFLEEITVTVTKLSHEQGGTIPFMVIREVVENYIHAFFIEPTVSILDGGNTIRFSDQGPGISEKNRALEFGTSSATEEMKKYIRGVGSGLPYAQNYMNDKGGSLTIEDNISSGTIVTISMSSQEGHIEDHAKIEETTNQTPSQVSPQQMWYAPQPQMVPQGQWMMPPTNPYLVATPYPQQAQQPIYQAQQPLSSPHLGDKETKILGYLSTHESVGPSDLVSAFGFSNPTWSRALTSLEEKGLVEKSGQKRYLTDAGQNMLGRV